MWVLRLGCEGTRVLPTVTPIHGVPTAVLDTQEGMIDKRFVDFSQLHKIYATPKGPLSVVENFDLKINRGSSFL
jgi:nitrate/nitrite transport system ATP-binding protein